MKDTRPVWVCEYADCAHVWLASSAVPPDKCAKCKRRRWDLQVRELPDELFAEMKPIPLAERFLPTVVELEDAGLHEVEPVRESETTPAHFRKELAVNQAEDVPQAVAAVVVPPSDPNDPYRRPMHDATTCRIYKCMQCAGSKR